MGPFPRLVRTPVESALRTGGAIGAAVIKPAVRGTSRAVVATLDGLLNSRLAGDAVERLAASPLAARAVHGALQGPLVDALAGDLVRYRVADRLLAEGLVEQITARVLEGEEFEYVLEATLESRLLDQAVVRLLESDDLWLIVDEIASSPAVTTAIAQQSASFADQVAGGVRSRSRSADAWLERRARRAFRRRPVPPPGSGAP
jgi:hypothetical protein